MELKQQKSNKKCFGTEKKMQKHFRLDLCADIEFAKLMQTSDLENHKPRDISVYKHNQATWFPTEKQDLCD